MCDLGIVRQLKAQKLNVMEDKFTNFILCSCVKHAFVHKCGMFAIKQSYQSSCYVEANPLGMTANTVGTWKVFKPVLLSISGVVMLASHLKTRNRVAIASHQEISYRELGSHD